MEWPIIIVAILHAACRPSCIVSVIVQRAKQSKKEQKALLKRYCVHPIILFVNITSLVDFSACFICFNSTILGKFNSPKSDEVPLSNKQTNKRTNERINSRIWEAKWYTQKVRKNLTVIGSTELKIHNRKFLDRPQLPKASNVIIFVAVWARRATSWLWSMNAESNERGRWLANLYKVRIRQGNIGVACYTTVTVLFGGHSVYEQDETRNSEHRQWWIVFLDSVGMR